MGEIVHGLTARGGVRREPTLAGAVQKDGGSLAFPQPTLFAALGGYPSSTGVPVSPFTALQATAVYACIKCLSEDIAKLPVVVRRLCPDGDWQVLTRHPLARLLRAPNRWQTPFEFWSFLVSSLCLRGNGYAAILRDHAGVPAGLIPLSPDRVSVLVSPKGWLYYHVSHPLVGEGVSLHQDDVLHVRNISVDGGYLGLSPIAASQDAVGLALATQQHGAVLFRQGAQLGGFLKTTDTLSPEAAARISQNWRDVYGGVQNAHKVAVLEGNLSYEKMGMTNEDAQFLATRAFQVIEICRLFRVPPHKIHDLSRATFSNIENQAQQYIDDALLPIAVRIEQRAEASLLFEDERDVIRIGFDFDSMLRGDMKSRFESYGVAIDKGFMNRQEPRLREGWRRGPAELDQFRVALNTSADGAKPATAGDAAPAAEPDAGTPADDQPEADQPLDDGFQA